MADPKYLFENEHDLVVEAQAAMTKIERNGALAVSRVTYREIAAMAALLQMLGVRPSSELPVANSALSKSHTPIDGEETL